MNFNGMFGKLAPGMCRLSMSGRIAVKTSNGYKTYNVSKGTLTNCDSFVFDIGEDFFFLVPTNDVKPGDIILVNGTPRCVVSVEKNQITAINYENGTVENIIPERHVFMGNRYMYGKILSMFGNVKGKDGMNNLVKYAMMSEFMKGNSNTGTNNGMNNMLPFMMMGGGFGDMFDGMFDFDADDDDLELVDEEEE